MAAGGEWDANQNYTPRLFLGGKSEKAGSAVSTEGVLPAEGTKQAGCRRGVGREMEAYSPPGIAAAGKTGGE